MSSKVVGGLAAAAILFLAGSSAAYSADMSVSRSKVYSSSRGLGTRHELGFWGNPFPYGYRWSIVRACERHEMVETPRGPRWHRVWGCRIPRRLANRYEG